MFLIIQQLALIEILVNTPLFVIIIEYSQARLRDFVTVVVFLLCIWVKICLRQNKSFWNPNISLLTPTSMTLLEKN